ncbi:MAG: Ig-like domain-containing protein, partial [Xanthomonadales bacterium]|nr:Ig-like domain-containing protein [Xanthomonadales bacterium]
MIRLQYVRRRLILVVAAVFVLAISGSCVNTGMHSYAPEASDSEAKPEISWVPYPVASQPVNPNAAAIAKIVVPSVKRNPRATYRQNTPHLRVSMPDFEIPVAGAGGGRKSFRIPAPEYAQPIGVEDPVPLALDGVDARFDSTGFDDNATYNGGFIFIPPDNHAAAGPNHLVNVVNTTISFHQKDGALDNRYGLETFFSALSPLTATFDPKVLYDQYEDRWVVITMEQTQVAYGDAADTSRMFVAVSDDSDPNGTWYFAEFDTVVNAGGVDNWADYPGFGVDEEAVYIAANLFPFGGGSGNGSRVWILEKGVGTGGLYDSGGTLVVSELNPYAGGGIATTTQVSHMFGASPATGVGVFLVSYSGINGGGTEYVQVVRLDDPLGSPSFVQQYISLGDIELLAGGLPDMPQTGSSELINSNDRRALDAVWRDGYLWMTTTIDPNSGPDSGQATAMWIKIDTSNLGSLTIADSGTIGGEDIATGAYTTFPSIAVNANEDVVVGFSASAPSIYAGAYFAGRVASDPAGFMGSSVIVREGVDWYFRDFNSGRNRWGDYSGTAVDPADGCFWVYNQWADTRSGSNNGGTGRWATTYAKTCNTPENLPPVAVDDADSVAEDGAVDINVVGNDSDPEGDDFSVVSVSNPPNGSASVNPDDTIAYSPDPNYNGTDNFTYSIEDTFSGTDSATVTVTVSAVNDAPDAVDDSATAKETDPVDIDVLLNDDEVDGESLSISAVTQGTKGSVSNNTTYVTYQANGGLTLPTTDTFTYTAWDGQPSSTDTATVTVTINPKAPPVSGFSFSISDLEVTFTDTSTDSDGSIVNWAWDFDDTNTSIQQNPVHTYGSYGSYDVTLTVTDDDGLTDDFTDTVTLVEPPPTAPSGLSATAISANHVDVSWTDNSGNEASFTLERSDNGGSSWTPIVLGADVTSYRDSGLNGSTTYDYRVYATGAGGDSAPSNTDTATTFEACSANK